MQNFNLIKSILSEAWYIAQSEAEQVAHLVAGIFDSNLKFEEMTADQKASYSSTVSASLGGAESRTYSVGVAKIQGALTKYGTMCSYGMEDYARIISKLASDNSIDAIVLNIDSPGGSVSGTQELASLIRSIDIPVVAFVSDMACSAAYWVASAADEVIANNTTARVGSIGVMCTLVDMSESYRKQGIKIHTLYAPQSTNKNLAYRSADKGDTSLITQELSVYADKFISTIKEWRPSITEEQLTGQDYFAQDVVGSLVDSIGNFDYALNRAVELASLNSNTNNKTTQMSKSNFPTLAKATGAEELATLDGSMSLTTEQAQAAETALASAEATAAQNATLAEQLASVTAERAAAQSSLATTQTELTAANSTIATLRSTVPGATSATTEANPTTDPAAQDEATQIPSSYAGFASAMASAEEMLKHIN